MRHFHTMKSLTQKLNNLEKRFSIRKEYIVIVADDRFTADFAAQGVFTSKEEYETYLQWRCDSIAEEYAAGKINACIMVPDEHDIALHIEEFRAIRPSSSRGTAIILHLPIELVEKNDLGSS